MISHIVSIKDNLIFLSTSLSEDAFGRTQYIREIDENGFVATIPEKAADTSDVTFEPWKFTGTKTDENGIVAFAGPSLGGGKTLYEIFENGTQSDMHAAAKAVLFALTAALEQNVALNDVGAEGIMLFAETRTENVAQETDENRTTPSYTRILFLPANLFDRSANNTRENYADYQGFFIRKGLTGTDALLFTRAVIAYRALCGTLPYPERDLSKRQADIFDARFVPSYMQINGLNSDLASAIDCGLQVSAEAKPLPGERRFVSEKDEERRKKILATAKRFSLDVFAQELTNSDDSVPATRTPELSEEEFIARRERFLKKQTATVKRRRFTRRNHSRLIVAGIAIVLAVWAITSFQRENQKLATSKGLTSWETTQELYATIHKSSVPHLQEIAKGKNLKNLKQIVSGFYVTNRSRFAMNQNEDTVSTAEWLFFKNKTKYWQFGLTQLTIDGKSADVFYKYPTRADKPEKLTAEEGVTLKRGATVQHKAEYFLVNSDGDARLSINQVRDTVTLTWKGSRWIVTDVKSKNKQQFVFTKDFSADYQAALDATGGDVSKSVALLREKYDWLPTDEEINAGELVLHKRLR
ncbi:MAG: hypothetical protein IJS09_05670 [Treponema sp.]|nr:hypothetical protein [Treponema sp.]